MVTKFYRSVRSLTVIAFSLAVLALAAMPAAAGEYAALTGVKGLDSVFDFSLGSAEVAAVIFPAILDVHQNKEVRALPAAPRFRNRLSRQGGPVDLYGPQGLEKKELEAYDKVAGFIRQLRRPGSRWRSVCMR